MRNLLFTTLFSVCALFPTVGCHDKVIFIHRESNQQQSLLDAHNQERASHGKPALIVNVKLTASAQKHAEWMATHTLSHEEGFRGKTVGERITAEGFQWTKVGENVAEGQRDVSEVMRSWMKSKGHRANILDNYLYVGFGVATSKNGTIFWCVDFASP